MADLSKKKILIRLTSEQQTDLKKALGITEKCAYLELSLEQRNIETGVSIFSATESVDGGSVVLYGVLPPGHTMDDTTVKIFE